MKNSWSSKIENIQKTKFNNIEFYVLRDDLLGEFNGNKARKLEYFLNVNLQDIKSVVSYGSAQSNAMYSLSVFCKMKGFKFHYVVSNISSNLLQNPVGNLKFALENEMKIYICKDRAQLAKDIFSKLDNALFINEGIAQKEAEYGFITQANLINQWAKNNNKIVDIFLPSGTGTSAAFLAKHTNFRVFTCACVGDEEYLKAQINALDPFSKVQILNPPRKYHFGDLKLELYDIWLELLKQTNIEFELIYDPVGFISMIKNLDVFNNEILYIHQGGVLGNISQKMRYERKIKERR
ncbi:MAG: 1-aminocyclopropane-1-carboxylate deaminase [Campylobacter sp.]